jgi:hypothetical protein
MTNTSILSIIIPMVIGALIIMYIILEFASILTFGQQNGKEITKFKNNMNFKQSFINFYKAIKLINIKEFDDSFEVHTRINGGYILNSISYYMKIIDVDNVLLITKSSYQFGYTLSTYKKINNDFKEHIINITDAPAPFYWYRYHRLDKLIKKTECRLVEPNDVNKIINDHYTIYNRDTKLKELLND